VPERDLDQVPDEPLGDHVLELQIAEVVAETDDARSLVFAVPDEQGDPDIPPQRLRYAPGQFLTLRVPSDRTGSVARCYSLCSSPFTDDALTVTVKRTADGYASNWLCDHAAKACAYTCWHRRAPSCPRHSTATFYCWPPAAGSLRSCRSASRRCPKGAGR